MESMVFIEVTRLALGLLIALFHKPLADFIVEQDSQLVAMFRRRGVSMPDTLRRDTARNLYFAMGIIVAMVELARIWTIIHH
jgi:predicted type IV restriction endonuclease